MNRPQLAQFEKTLQPMVWSPYLMPSPMPRTHILLSFIFKCEVQGEGGDKGAGIEKEPKVVVHRVYGVDQADAMHAHERDPLCSSHKAISVQMEY